MRIYTLAISLLLFLAWVPWGEAGCQICDANGKNCVDGHCDVSGGFDHIAPDSGLWNHEQADLRVYPPDMDGALRVTLVDPCLAQMEAAMKAMNPYLPYVHNGKALDPFELNKVISELMEAGKLWESTAKDCWSRP